MKYYLLYELQFILGNRDLEVLSVDEVTSLFISLNLHIFLEFVALMRIDGRTLFLCKSMKDLKELKLVNKIKGKVLLWALKTYREDGVPATMLVPAGSVKKKN